MGIVGFSYDLSTDVGKIRLAIFDTNPDSYIFEDAELSAFLSMEGSNVKRAAALALETIASNEAYVLKAIRLLDISTDGAKTAAALMQRAAALRQQADRDDAAASGGAFDVAEWVVSDFAWRERILSQDLRNG